MSLCALKFMFLPLFFVLLASRSGSAIWCYRCTSSTPGCGEDFNWRGIGYLGEKCSEDEDICMKVIERRGAKEIITRDCLSSLSFRTDVPADKYEGCRPAANDVHLADYVNHTTKEHDVKRNYYSNVTFCFCFLDHRCNKSGRFLKGNTIIISSLSSVIILFAVRVY
uniref:Uncharacterized protein n=1 Tax=Glossina pallidipes TaxID=7398 RepID=A0A1B0AEH0_GLOPL